MGELHLAVRRSRWAQNQRRQVNSRFAGPPLHGDGVRVEGDTGRRCPDRHDADVEQRDLRVRPGAWCGIPAHDVFEGTDVTGGAA